MPISPNITASIVVYKEEIANLQKTIDSFINSSLSKKLYIIDNSPTDILRSHIDHAEIEYIFSGKNLGFGKGHNQVLDKLRKIQPSYHLILNPDVEFEPSILEVLSARIEKEDNISAISPKAILPDNSLQFIARRFPSFIQLASRFFKGKNSDIQYQEYQDQNLENEFYPDFIHGIFMLFKTQDLLMLEGFDERFFLYMEDVDLCRKMKSLNKRILYYPKVKIKHQYRRGSSKSLKLFFIHLSSAVKYFNKWGY